VISVDQASTLKRRFADILNDSDNRYALGNKYSHSGGVHNSFSLAAYLECLQSLMSLTAVTVDRAGT